MRGEVDIKYWPVFIAYSWGSITGGRNTNLNKRADRDIPAKSKSHTTLALEQVLLTVRDVESPFPKVLCVLQTSDVQSPPIIQVFEAAESNNIWYSSELVPKVIVTM